MNMLIIVVLAALAGIFPALIAGGKGRSAAVWWLYGALLFPVALAHAWWLPEEDAENDLGDRKTADRNQVLCRGCSEPMPVTATRCRYCGTENVAAAGEGSAATGEGGIEAWDDAFASLVKGGGRGRPGPRPQPEPRGTVGETLDTLRRPPPQWIAAVSVAAALLMLVFAVSAIYDSGLSRLWTVFDGDEAAVALGDPATPQLEAPQSEAQTVEPAPVTPPPTAQSSARSAPAASAPDSPLVETAPKPAPPRPKVAPRRPATAEPGSEGDNSPGRAQGASPVQRAGSDSPDAGGQSPAAKGREDAAPEPSTKSSGGSTAVAKVPDKPAKKEKAEQPANEPRSSAAPQQASREDGVSRPSGPSSGGDGGETVTAVGDLVYWIQRELSNLGYFRGEIDGRAGESTRDAIRAFQRAQRLTPTGEIDQTLITSLRRASPGREGRRRGLNDRRPPSSGAIATAEPGVPAFDD